jgi:hypothetical protein
MSAAVPTELPEAALLRQLQRNGGHTDCYTTQLPMRVTQAEYIEAFYTTPLFKAERLLLRLLASKPSTDQGARDLAQGRSDAFAVWRVAQRRPEQILLTDMTGRTSSWLMAVPDEGPERVTTRLFFGSAVTGRTNHTTGRREMGLVFHALLGFHKLYSRLLLQAAAARLLGGKVQGT